MIEAVYGLHSLKYLASGPSQKTAARPCPDGSAAGTANEHRASFNDLPRELIPEACLTVTVVAGENPRETRDSGSGR